MAKLDQSFIKAYGHVGLRAGTARPAAPNANASSASSNAVPLISAAPVVVDTDSFAFDTVNAIAHDSAAMSAPRPHILAAQPSPAIPSLEEPVAAPRKPRRAPAKRAAAVSQGDGAANIATTFQADSFSVDIVAERPPIAKPSAPPKPAETKRQAPRLGANDFCHRACTVEFSSVAGTAVETDDECVDIEEENEPVYAAFTPAALPNKPHDERHALEATTATDRVAHQATTATRIDGVAYHRVPAAPVASLRTGYEVDAFRWPDIVDGLSGRATIALSTLIDELVDASSIGRGVVMFAGERRGAGATTLAAYAARRLAQLGLSVALVDADFAKPALARSLGVAVEFGWDDALHTEQNCSPAMIASLGDGVTILPLRHAVTVNGAKAARIAADLAVLRKHFALVILDGGPLAEVAEPWIAQAPEDTIDCAIVVRDVRIDAAHTSRRPHAQRCAALPAIGVVENFVHELPATT